MPFIDPRQIQILLENAKLSSITEIVTFIADHVGKATIHSLSQFDQRLAQLERPKGMDRVMIEEVKTLVQAMLDQREEGFRRELEKKYRGDVCNSFQMPEMSRRSLNEVDFMNLMNMQNGVQSQQLRKTHSIILPNNAKNQSIMNQIRDLREQLMNRAQRRDIQQIKAAVTNLGKQVVSKITFQQVQKLILKFQKDIFIKIGQSRGILEEMDSRLQREMESQSQSFKKQLQQINKSLLSNKIERRIRKQNQQLQLVKQKMDRNAEQYKLHQKQVHQDLSSLQVLVQQFTQQKDNHMLLQNSQRSKKANKTGFWISAPASFKNSCVAWEREVFNYQANNMQFDSGKTGIRLVTTGFYQIACAIYGGGNCKKQPILMCNSEVVAKFEGRDAKNQLGNDYLPKWTMREWVHVRQSRSQLSVKMQGQQNSSCVMLMITRLN